MNTRTLGVRVDEYVRVLEQISASLSHSLRFDWCPLALRNSPLKPEERPITVLQTHDSHWLLFWFKRWISQS